MLLLPMVAQAWVHNESNHSVWVKPENENKPIEVKAGQKYLAAQDGLTIPYNHPNSVFKTCNRCSVVVGSKGELKQVNCESFQSKICQFSFGGWKDIDFARKRLSWLPLFSTAQQKESTH